MSSSGNTKTDIPAIADSDAPPRDTLQGRLVGLAEAYTIPVVTVLLIVAFAVLPATSGTFFTLDNARAVLGSQAVIAILTLAALVPLVINCYDLSIGANMGVAAVVGALVMGHGGSLWLAVPAAVATSTVIGLVNGLIVTRLGVNDVVTTLGMTTVLVGVVAMITGGRALTDGISGTLIDFTTGTLFGIPTVVFAVAIVALAVHFAFERSVSGRHLFMLGANKQAAHLIGLKTERLTLSAFAIAGLLAGIAGVIQLGRAGGAVPSTGDNFTLPALAAAFLSQAAIRPGRVNVGGAITAIVFLAVLNGGLNLAGAPPYISNYVNGAALVLGIALAAYIGRIRDRYQARRAT